MRPRRAGKGIVPPRLGGLFAVVVLCSTVGSAAAAQTPERLRDRCLTAGGAADVCAATGVAARALAGDVGIAAGLGSEISGTASNLGERLGEAPRWSIGARGGVVRGSVPDLRSPSAAGEASYDAWTVQAEVGAGLFDGFRLRPGAGGFLALDVFGRAGFVLLAADEGFEGSVTAMTVGARIGILRESFSLPGVSLSASRRWIGDVILSDTVTGPVRLAVDPAVTSIRATVGKDLFAWELMAGFGWDDYGATAGFLVPNGSGGFQEGSGRIDEARTLWFVGASRTFGIVFSLALEGGLASGFAPVSGFDDPAYDPTRSTFFASAGLRLIV